MGEKEKKVTLENGEADKQNELVTVHLFRDSERYKDDVFVAVNGTRFQIKRGVDVQVPRYVQEVLEHSRDQDIRAAELEDALVRKYEGKNKE